MSEPAVMTFREHLGELRTRLVRIALVVMVGFFVGWEFREAIFGFLSAPVTEALADNGIYRYQAITITESIVVYLKAVLVATLLVTSPFVFYQLWAFVAPGLLDRERRFILPVTAFSVVFFFIGSAFSYQVILPFIVDWLVKLTQEGGGVEMQVTLQNAFSTSFTFLAMFGLVFELPLVIFFMSLMGTVTHTGLLKFWRYFVVISFIVSGILTPPDPISQTLMAVPLNALYGLGILVAWAVTRARGDGTGDEPSRTDVGLSSLKLMGGALVLVALAASLVVVFIRTLPAPELSAMVPQRAAWVVGLNPAVLAEAPNAAGGKAIASLSAVLEDAGVDVPIHDGLVVGLPDGRRATLLRAEGLGARLDGLSTALAASARDAALVARGLDPDTVVLGDAELVTAVEQAAQGTEALATTRDEQRLLDRLRVSGPVWAWVPAGGGHAEALVGRDMAADLAAVGAFVALGDTPRITVELRASDRKRADALETHLETARNAQRDARERGKNARLAAAILQLTAELKRSAAPDAQQRLALLEAELADLAPSQSSTRAPLVAHLGAHAEALAVRRQDTVLTLTAQLDDEALETLLAPLLAR